MPDNKPNREMTESEFWENELNAMAADDYDCESELNSMIMREGVDYFIAPLESTSATPSAGNQIEQDVNNIKTSFKDLEHTQRQVSEIHGALFNPLDTKEKDTEEQLTAMILARGTRKRRK